MILHRIDDWDDAYTNGANIARGDRWPAAWVEPARDFRDRLAAAGRARLDLDYGPSPRHRFDLFLPEGAPKGLVVFVHGGFWLNFDKSFWSHLAAGSVDSMQITTEITDSNRFMGELHLGLTKNWRRSNAKCGACNASASPIGNKVGSDQAVRAADGGPRARNGTWSSDHPVIAW